MFLLSSKTCLSKLKSKKTIRQTLSVIITTHYQSSSSSSTTFSTFTKPGNSQSNYLSTVNVLSKQKHEDFEFNQTITHRQTNSSTPLLLLNTLHSNDNNALLLHEHPNESWWTGKSPKMSTYIENQAHSLPFLSLEQCDKVTLQAYFDNTWTLTESLFAGLQGEEAFMVSPEHNLRHPLIFYYGHPAVLYVNKLRVAGLLKDPINPYFEAIFETGVDEMSWDDMSKNK
jgi:hypothetical protein